MASPVRNEAAPAAKTGIHSGSISAADHIVPLRNARRNCLNLKGVIAIKLVAAPRYQSRYVVSIPVSSSVAPRGRLDSAKVHHIRTAAVTDSHLARLYGVIAAAIRDARVGDTWYDHPTPPEKTPRSSWGWRGDPKARSSRTLFARSKSAEISCNGNLPPLGPLRLLLARNIAQPPRT
jgi:hypothetical protein